MTKLDFTSCRECKYYLKVTHEYCYHPKKFGTLLEKPETIPDWCPLFIYPDPEAKKKRL